MTKKVRRFALILAMVTALGVLGSACQSFSSLIPEEYGAWENYYIYRGNVRSKTTGEGGEWLVTSLEYDGKLYDVNDCVDYEIFGDDIYMCLSLSLAHSLDSAWEKSIVRYNIEEKSQELLQFKREFTDLEQVTWQYEPYTIEKVFDDEILLYGSRRAVTAVGNGELAYGEYHNLYYTIDLDGNIKEGVSFDYSDWSRVGEDYWTKTDYQDNLYRFTYRTWDTEDPIVICEGYDKAITFVEKNGVMGFLVTTTTIDEMESYGGRISALEFFNVKTNTLVLLWTGSDLEWVKVPEYEYFMETTTMKVDYIEWEDYVKKVKKSTHIRGNCKLWKIVYGSDGVRVESIHQFDKDKDFSRPLGVGDGKLYVDARWYSSASGCRDGGYNHKYYELDLQTKQSKSLKDYDEYRTMDDVCYAENALHSNGVTCGEYVYYIQREDYSKGLMMGNGTAFLLKRYHLPTEKIETLQLWSGKYYSATGEKCCSEMWKTGGGSIDDFIVRAD